MMLRIRETNILDMIDLYGEEECRIILSSFSCPFGKDVEDFISHKAIEFAKQRIAMTFLVFHERDEQLSMVGYYTLANKFVSVSGHMLVLRILNCICFILNMILWHLESVKKNMMNWQRVQCWFRC